MTRRGSRPVIGSASARPDTRVIPHVGCDVVPVDNGTFTGTSVGRLPITAARTGDNFFRQMRAEAVVSLLCQAPWCRSPANVREGPRPLTRRGHCARRWYQGRVLVSLSLQARRPLRGAWGGGRQRGVPTFRREHQTRIPGIDWCSSHVALAADFSSVATKPAWQLRPGWRLAVSNDLGPPPRTDWKRGCC